MTGPITPLTTRPVWKALEAHYAAFRALHLRTLFVDNPTRMGRMTAEAIGLYYGVLAFNLSITCWIGESFRGMRGPLMHLPVMARLIVCLAGPRGISPSR